MTKKTREELEKEANKIAFWNFVSDSIWIMVSGVTLVLILVALFLTN